MKSKGLKIKRSRKNLYKKRKSPGRKAAEVILLLLIVAALVFVGYSVAPPIINFFSGTSSSQTESSGPAWTPPQSEPEETEQTTDTTQTTPEPEVPVEEAGLNAVVAPETALASKSALDKFVKSAKSDGYNAIVFTLKNPTGELLYKTEIDSVKTNSNIVKGELTAKQIAQTCAAADIIPVAAISTLKDHIISRYFVDAGYSFTEENGGWSWLDAAADDGGKPWASPYSKEAVGYFSDIAQELSRAGFEDIILQNTVFPKFGRYDYGVLPSKVGAEDRSDLLAQLAQNCAEKADKSRSLVQIDAAEMMAYSIADYKGTAEIWKSRELMSDCSVLVTLDVKDLGTTVTISETADIELNKDMAKAIAQAYTVINRLTGNSEISVGISNSDDLTDTQKEAAKKTFGEMGYNDIIFM